MLQTFDDGSTLETDAYGSVIGGVDISGRPYNATGGASPVLQQFANLFAYGVKSIIDANYRAPVVAQQNAQTAQAANSQLIMLALLGVGAFFLLKAAH